MDAMGTFLQIGKTILDTLYWVVVIGLIAGGVFGAMFVTQFKHKIRVKQIINGTKKVIDFHFRITKDKDGTEWWHILQTREKIPPAPPEVIEVGKKGEIVAEAYRAGKGEYTFIRDGWTLGKLPPEIANIPDAKLREAKAKEWRQKNRVIEAYEPYTLPQRQILINQHEKALSERRTNWKEHIPMIVGVSAVVLLVTLHLVFWGDLTKPFLEAKQNQIEDHKILLKILETQERLETKIQTFEHQTQTGKPPN